jgi:environmental stress-induced protein Ves
VYHCRVPPSLQIIRKSSYTPRPWKNGGGMTHEAIRVPADGDAFAWRVSVAHIDASGPFSDFAAYNRKMVLIKGEGLELKFADGGRLTLRRVGDLAEFDGALATQCTLLGGPCVDLNLMVAKRQAAAVAVRRLTGTDDSLSASATLRESTLIFSIDDVVLLRSSGGETVHLEPWDLAILSNGSGSVTPLESRAGANPSAVFFATIGH